MPWNEIWRLLEIEETRDKRAIKRAYGKMVAKYHPEEQPEEFQKIRTAYEMALDYAETGSIVPSAILELIGGWDGFGDDAKSNISTPPENKTSIFSSDLPDVDQQEIERKQAEIKASVQPLSIYEKLLEDQFSGESLDEFLASSIFKAVRRNEWFIIEFMRLNQEHVWTMFLKHEHLESIRCAFGLNGYIADDSYIVQELVRLLDFYEEFLNTHYFYKGAFLSKTVVTGIYKRLRWYFLMLLLVTIPTVVSYDIGGIQLLNVVFAVTLYGVIIIQIARVIIRSRNDLKAPTAWDEIGIACVHVLFIGGLLGLIGSLIWAQTAPLIDYQPYIRVVIFGTFLALYLLWYVLRGNMNKIKNKVELTVTSWLAFTVKGGHPIGILYFILVAVVLWGTVLIGDFDVNPDHNRGLLSGPRLALRGLMESPDYTWTFNLPWSEEWGLETIRQYPEQALELERRIDWTVQRWLKDRYEGSFRTNHRLMMNNHRFDPLELVYYNVDNPEKEYLIRLYINWADATYDEGCQHFLRPDVHLRVEVPFTQLFIESQMEFFRDEEGIATFINFEQEIHDVVIPFIYDTFGMQLINFQNQNLQERGIDDMLIGYDVLNTDSPESQLLVIRVIPVWGSDDDFGISCWFSYHGDDIDKHYCD